MGRDMTEQDIFDFVCVKLVEQGGPSRGLNSRGQNRCLYRGLNGRKCAAGHFIPDERYVPEIENRNIRTLSSRLLEEVQPHVKFLAKLQRLHDWSLGGTDEEWFAAWTPTMLELASARGLSAQKLMDALEAR